MSESALYKRRRIIALSKEKAMGEERRVRRYTLEEARGLLGEDAFIELEPEVNIVAKKDAGKSADLWGFDCATGQIRRGDGKFHAAGVVLHPGGWYLGAIIEEPNSDQPATGPHIVGHIIVDVNPRGLVRTRHTEGLNRKVLELKPSSLSKGELDESGHDPDCIIEANPQHICGSIAVYRHNTEFPDEEGMLPGDFIAASTDGRSLAAVAKLFFQFAG